MNPRRIAVLAAFLLAVGATWFVQRGLRRALPAHPGAPPSAEERPAAGGALTPSEDAVRVTVAPVHGDATDESEIVGGEDPPTPARPGPAQALLRVEVVARETAKALAGVQLGLSSTADDDDHEWRTSTQSDPSRGVE